MTVSPPGAEVAELHSAQAVIQAPIQAQPGPNGDTVRYTCVHTHAHTYRYIRYTYAYIQIHTHTYISGDGTGWCGGCHTPYIGFVSVLRAFSEFSD